jgi:peroxiredoxin
MDKGSWKALAVVGSLIVGMILVFGGAMVGYKYYANTNQDKNNELLLEGKQEQKDDEKNQESPAVPNQLEEKSSSDTPPVQEQVPEKNAVEDKAVSEKTVEEGVQRLQQAPDFSLDDLQGKPIKLSQYRGKIVFLNFWATWCPPCRIEMPAFQSANNRFKEDDKAVILAVNIQENNKKVKAFIEENKYGFDVVLDLDGEVAGQYKIHSIPTTYIIDQDGIIRDIAIGPMEEEYLYDYVEELSGE